MPPEEFPPEPAPWHERALAVAYVMVPVIRFTSFIVGIVPAIFIYAFWGYGTTFLVFLMIGVGGFLMTFLLLAVGAAKIAQAERDHPEPPA